VVSGAGRDHRAAILRHAHISNIGQVDLGDNTRAKSETTGKFYIVKLGDIELVGNCIHHIDHHVPSAPEDRARLGADRAAYQRQQRQGKHGNNGKLTPHLASSSETRVARLFRSTSVTHFHFTFLAGKKLQSRPRLSVFYTDWRVFKDTCKMIGMSEEDASTFKEIMP